MDLIPAQQLSLKYARNPMPSVELDLAEVELLHPGYGPVANRILAQYAQTHPKTCASIYTYEGPSCNFIALGWSVFFAGKGCNQVLTALYQQLRSAGLKNVRMSDYISPGTAMMQFHLQDGVLWRPDDVIHWYRVNP